MTTALARRSEGAAALVAADWTADQVGLIKRTCCGGKEPPTDAFQMFLHVCKVSGLDPLLKEAWLVERAGTWQPMAGRDGYLAAAHRSGVFSGIQTDVFPEDARQAPTHAVCTVYRRDWQVPVRVTVAFREYADDRSPLWRNKPRTMIAKVAEAHALRRAFSLHGTYMPEELPEEEPATRRKATAECERPRLSAALAAPAPALAPRPAPVPPPPAAPEPPPPVPEPEPEPDGFDSDALEGLLDDIATIDNIPHLENWWKKHGEPLTGGVRKVVVDACGQQKKRIADTLALKAHTGE